MARVRAHLVDRHGRHRMCAFVVKRLEGASRREAAIYQSLLARAGDAPAPLLLGVDGAGPAACYLYLESVRPWRAWPWADLACAGLVLDQLAAVHTHLASLASDGVLVEWDYERELAGSAQMTLVAWERAADAPDLSWLRRALPALRRLVDVLPVLRRQLRDACWLAAASNMLAGTLRYYVAVLDGYGQPAPQLRRDALRAVQDGMRTIRRAAACWRA